MIFPTDYLDRVNVPLPEPSLWSFVKFLEMCGLKAQTAKAAPQMDARVAPPELAVKSRIKMWEQPSERG